MEVQAAPDRDEPQSVFTPPANPATFDVARLNIAESKEKSMRESNRTAILHALEDAAGSEPADQLALAVEWVEFYWQRTSAGAIREVPPHLTRVVKRQPPEPVLIPGEA